jgi:DNA-binding CsgD family transcriptional regulator
MLAAHLTFPEIAGEMLLSRYIVKSEAMSLYRKLEASSRSQAVARSRELGSWRADLRVSSHRGDATRPAAR